MESDYAARPKPHQDPDHIQREYEVVERGLLGEGYTRELYKQIPDKQIPDTEYLTVGRRRFRLAKTPVTVSAAGGSSGGDDKKPPLTNK